MSEQVVDVLAAGEARIPDPRDPTDACRHEQRTRRRKPRRRDRVSLVELLEEGSARDVPDASGVVPGGRCENGHEQRTVAAERRRPNRRRMVEPMEKAARPYVPDSR